MSNTDNQTIDANQVGSADLLATRQFPQRLKCTREMRKLTQSSLAKITGLEPSAISHFETGERTPSMKNLVKLCVALEVRSEYLLSLCHLTPQPKTLTINARSYDLVPRS